MKKINIQYLWIDKWRNYENAGFNFSDKYKFDYNKDTNELRINNNSQNYCNNFFGNNIDITAIIGQNGAGKTSLLEYLVKIATESELNFKFIIAFEESENGTSKLRIYSRNINHIKCNFVTVEPYDIEVLKEYEIVTILYNYALTNTHHLQSNDNFFDFTTAHLINQSDKNQGTRLTSYHNDERMMQLRFLSHFGGHISDFGIKYSEKIDISFNNLDFYVNKFSNDFNQYINDTKILIERENINYDVKESKKEYLKKCISFEFSDNIKDFIRNLFISSESKGKILFFEKITYALFNELLAIVYYYKANFFADGKFYINMLEFIDKIYKEPKDKDSITKAKQIFDNTKELLDSLDLLYPQIDTIANPWISLSGINTKFNDFICFFENSVLKDESIVATFSDTTFKIKFEKGTDGNVSAIEFFNEYTKISKYYDFLSFNYNMSSGEIALLSLYSRFYSILDINRIGSYKHRNLDMKNRNAIILLDEAEVLFHPEWQRKYIYNLISFFKNVFSESHL